MSVRPKADSFLGWAYRPDAETQSSLHRGALKLREHPELGSDKPHERGNMAEALAEEKAALAAPKKRAHKGRRKKMAKKVEKMVTVSKKKTLVAKSKGEDKGKMIPLKAICADLELDPKATRVKLRRLIEEGEITFHNLSQRWEFTPSQAKEIRAHLS